MDTKLSTAHNISEQLFNDIYDRLMVKAKDENYALAIEKMAKMTKKQIKSGVHVCGNWQRLLNDFVAGKIETTHVIGYLQQENLQY